MAELWTQGSDTTKITTDANGKASFENIEIPAVNEITPGSIDYHIRLSGNELETEINTISLTDGDYNKTYYITEKNTQPEDKQYTLIINSQNEKGENENNVGWTISTTDGTLNWSGNTGSNALDTLQFLNPNTSLNLNIHSSKEEHTEYNTTKSISSGQTTITTVNELLKYLYEMQVSGKDSETKALLDSIDVKAFLNGQLLMSGNSLANTSLNLQTTQAGHSLDLKVLMDRNGYVRSDSIPITINEGQANNLVYELVKEQTTPTDKQYTLVINSKDGEGNNLPNVNWTVSTTTGNTIGFGNTGSNSLDTLLFENTNPDLDVIIESNKEEHTNYSGQTNLTAEQTEVRTTQNQLLKYLYEMQVSGKDSETQTALDSIKGEIYLNGKLLTSGNSLANQILNLQTTQAGHELDIMSILNRNGYEADTITTTINEGQANQIMHELTKEQTGNQEAVAYLWRAIRDPLNQLGTTADITITNDEFNYTDTRSVQDLTAWKDTVPVNPTGTTPYTITIHPHVADGKIPLYDLVKTINLSPNQTSQGYDDLKSLEQQVVLKGDLDGSDGGEAGVVNVVFTNSSGQQFTTTTTSDGKYRLGPFPVGTKGDIDFIIPTNNPKSSAYFNHKDIPVGGTPIVKLGTVPLTSGPITAFEDSVLTYNPMMIQKQWTYPVTGEKVTIHPEYLKDLEGNSYNASWALWGEQRVYNTPNSDNPDWPAQMGAFIEKHTGVPFKVIVVDTERAKSPPPQMNSLDPTYLESIRNQMGINAESIEGTSGLTNVHSAGSTNNLAFHTTADVRLRAPSIGEEATDFMHVVGMRELIGRNGELSETNQYVSFMNGATPQNLTISNMIQDFANVAIIYTNMSSRAKKKTHTGLGTLSE